MKGDRLWHPSELSARMVPYNQLPAPGDGAFVAAAIRAELSANDYSEPWNFTARPVSFPRCLNCGEPRREVVELGGWCEPCTNRQV